MMSLQIISSDDRDASSKKIINEMKKEILLYTSAILFLLAITSCKKELGPEVNAGLTVVNALPGTDQLLVHFKAEDVFNDKTIAGMMVKYGFYTPDNHLTIPIKEIPLTFYTYHAGTVEPKPVYQTRITPNAGDATTLFLFGTLAQPETLLITKMPPYHAAADSVMGLRFVNLSMDKIPVKIRISGEGIDQTLSNLAYKGATDYVGVKATLAVKDVKIEFYDQSSGVLLTSYTLNDVGAIVPQIANKWRYRNFTMVLSKDAQGNFTKDPFLIYDF